MNWSLLPRSILMVWLMIPISACQDSQDKTSASTPESSAFRSALNSGPSALRRAGSDARCIGIMGRINPEWDDGDLNHMCSWGADVSCLSCWASNHPNASPSNILDNCLPDENGDDSDLYGNGCYNGPGADYGGPYTPPQPPSQPGFPTDPGYGRNCSGRLAQIRPTWSPRELNAACSGAEAECVVSMARQRPTWSSRELNAACSEGDRPQPPPTQPLPPTFPSDPGYGRNCSGRLAQIRPTWSPRELNAACSGAETECVVSMARARPTWSPRELNAACTSGDQTPTPPSQPPGFPQNPGYGRNCAGRLAALRPTWSPRELNAACSEAETECVISMASARPTWSPRELKAACPAG
jgi:hypothetical protein